MAWRSIDIQRIFHRYKHFAGHTLVHSLTHSLTYSSHHRQNHKTIAFNIFPVCCVYWYTCTLPTDSVESSVRSNLGRR